MLDFAWLKRHDGLTAGSICAMFTVLRKVARHGIPRRALEKLELWLTGLKPLRSLRRHSSSWLTFPEPNARPAAILVDKLNACFGEHSLYQLKSFWVSCIAANLQIADRVSVETGRLGKVPHGPIKGRPGHAYLCACHRNFIVPLSHVMGDQSVYHM